jgi:uncharacterized protein (DUF1800 family)
VLSTGIERYIDQQLEPGPDPGLDQRMKAFPSLNWSMETTYSYYLIDQATGNDANTAERTNYIGTLHNEQRGAQLVRAVHSENQLQEVMAWFWFNHFNVNLADDYVQYSVHDYEKVLRAGALGKFPDLLSATAHHPAMMSYLDNYLSTISKFDRTGKLTSGLNENYGRELMELHTLGVDAGYTQEHVYNAAIVLTGWGLNRNQGRFVFTPANHDPRETEVFGLKIPAGQMQQSGEALLGYLAAHEKTAQFISTKLVRHFVNDDPPAALVGRVAKVYMSSGGDVKEMLREIFGSNEFWAESLGAGKYRNPFQYVVGTLRALDAEVADGRSLSGLLNNMGQPQYGCIPPTGWTDKGREWVNPSSQVYRMNFALDLVSSANTTPFAGITVDVGKLLRGAGVDATKGKDVAQFLNGAVFGNKLSAVTLAGVSAVPSGTVPLANRVLGLILAGPEAQGR